MTFPIHLPPSARKHVRIVCKWLEQTFSYLPCHHEVISWHLLTVHLRMLIMIHILNRNMLEETCEFCFFRESHSARKSLKMPRALLYHTELPLWEALCHFTLRIYVLLLLAQIRNVLSKGLNVKHGRKID